MFTEDLVYLIVKYLLEGLAVAVSAFYLSSKKTSVKETIMLGTVASVTFLLLDLFSPSIGSSTRTGAGLGIGLQRVGFEPFEDAKKRKELERRKHAAKVLVQGFEDGDAPEEVMNVVETPEGYRNYGGFTY